MYFAAAVYVEQTVTPSDMHCASKASLNASSPVSEAWFFLLRSYLA